jgi:ABC-type lipoprotein release transport system permease subunit
MSNQLERLQDGTALGNRIPAAREMMTVVVSGVGIGAILALFATPVRESLLFDVAPSDPFTLAATAGVLALVTMLATWLPARRAAASDPMDALRE